MVGQAFFRSSSQSQLRNRYIMPATNFIRGGIFAAGLAAGLGAATLLNQKQATLPPPPRPAQAVADERSTSLVAQGGNPNTVISRPESRFPVPPPSSPSASNQLASDVFRYGFPGSCIMLFRPLTTASLISLHHSGPIPDILKRTAYVAAYDRRLRHPSWASLRITPPVLALINSRRPASKRTDRRTPHSHFAQSTANP